MRIFCIVLSLFLYGCKTSVIHTEFTSDACIKPLINHHYVTCNKIYFTINEENFEIPTNFNSDLSPIYRIGLPINNSIYPHLIRAEIVHDWLYRKTCDFSRYQTDLIFYHMLLNNGASLFRASVMYYTARLFGWHNYNEDYCENECKRMD